MIEDDYNAVMAQFQTEQTQLQLQQQMNALLPSVLNEIILQLQSNNTITVDTGNIATGGSISSPSTPDPIAQWQDLYSQLNPS